MTAEASASWLQIGKYCLQHTSSPSLTDLVTIDLDQMKSQNHKCPAMYEALLTWLVSALDVDIILFNTGPSLIKISFVILIIVRQLVVILFISDANIPIPDFDVITSLSMNLSLSLKTASVASRKESQVLLVSAFSARCKEQ